MGLDAKVYCDCFEKGRLNVPERFAGRLRLDWTGRVDLSGGDMDDSIAFDEWRNTACQHEEGILLHEWLGNVAWVTRLWSLLAQLPTPPDFILDRVVYSGTHYGDSVQASELDVLSREVDQISEQISDACDDPEMAYYGPHVMDFCRQLKGLVEASQSVGKPIVF